MEMRNDFELKNLVVPPWRGAVVVARGGGGEGDS